MSLFVWYSNNSKESGKLVAEKLEAEDHGNTPPKGFTGAAVCWGAAPKDVFKWENRNFQAVFNDPRKVRAYLDRKLMFDKLAEAGVNVVSYTPLAEEAQYVNICNILGAEEARGFVACRKNGSKARVVTCQAELASALAEGCTRALDRVFASRKRLRVFVADGLVIGAVRRGAAEVDDAFLERAAKEVKESDVGQNLNEGHIRNILGAAIGKGTVAPSKSYWAPAAVNQAGISNAAQSVAASLEFDFCAVDFHVEENGNYENGNYQVINVVTTPNLREVPSIHSPLINAIGGWVERHTKTAKELLQDIIDDCNENDAAVMLEELRRVKREENLAG